MASATMTTAQPHFTPRLRLRSSYRLPVKVGEIQVDVPAVSRRELEKVYYHAGMDIGGAEGLTEIVSATDGKIFTLAEKAPKESHPVTRPRYDVIAKQSEKPALMIQK